VTAVGATHICLRKFDQAKVWQLIENEEVTHMSGSPNLYAALLNHPERPEKLKHTLVCGVGGGQPSAALIEQLQHLGAKIIHGYGLTETYGPYMLCEVQPQWQKLSRRDQAKLLTRQGVPSVLGDPARVVDENMRDIRPDGHSIGEVVMRGAHVMKGYYKEPEATARDFRGGWFHSGDLAAVYPDGYIELRDRLLDIVVVGGEKVSSNEVEQTLGQHPDVLEAAVVSVPHDKLGETAKAFVVLKKDSKVKARQLISFCRQHLAGFKCPTEVEFVSSLPRTSTGKVQKFLLREREWIGQEKRIHGV
jgi:fatty-acyl-CoA synthase